MREMGKTDVEGIKRDGSESQQDSSETTEPILDEFDPHHFKLLCDYRYELQHRISEPAFSEPRPSQEPDPPYFYPG